MDEDDDHGGEWELKPHEVVCDACRLVRNKYTDGCGNCFVGQSVHEKRQDE